MPTPDDDDDKDITPKGLTRRLTRVEDLLDRASTRLTRIKAGFADPPEPDHVALLNKIKAHSAKITTLADDILRNTR